MLNIQNLSYLQGGIPLFQNVSLLAYSNQRIGLVGKNGCGKSTLFRLIRGEIKPDSGEVSIQPGKTIAYVEQEIANSDQPALEFVLDGDAELRLLEKTLARDKHDAEWFDAQHQAFNKQQEKIAHLEDYVRRFRAKNQWGQTRLIYTEQTT